jgi:type I restriction enzyme S subunit
VNESSKTNWRRVRLGDYLSVLTDYHANGSYKKLKANVELLDTPDYAVMIRTTNFEKNDFTTDLKYITKSAYDFLQKSKVQSGDILMNKIANAGSVYYMPDLHRPVSLAMNLFLIRTDKKYTDQRYIYYYLKGNEKYIKQFAIGTAATTITKESVRNLEILLPPLPSQRKIAGILSAYDELIENNRRRIEILEEMARSIYREWFVNFRFPGHEQVQMVDSELGPIPEGWEPVKLGDIAQDIRRSINPDLINPETPYFGLEHLPRKSIALSEWGTASQVQSTKLFFHKGEILFGKIRPYFHKVGVAPVEGVCSSDAVVIKAKATDYFPIVLACVSSEEFVAHATQTSQGTKMPRANWDVLIKYPVVIPPLPLLYQFNEFMQNTLAQIHNLIFKNRNLRQTRDLLLPRLISGEIDVENLDINTGPIAA